MLLRLLSYDVVFYNYGLTLFTPPFRPRGSTRKLLVPLYQFYTLYMKLMQRLELRLLAFFGKVLVVQYQGDDARQSDYCLNNYSVSIAHAVDQSYYPPGSDQYKREQISLLSKYVHHVYALNPDLLRVLPPHAKFLPYAIADSVEHVCLSYASAADRLVVVHAPSNRQVKGTALIEDAFTELTRLGYGVKLLILENLTHESAIKVSSGADLAIDQLFAGWYGGFALECMAMGKPVATYINEQDLSLLPPFMANELPFLPISAATLLNDLKTILSYSRPRLREIGMRSRKFAEKWHDPLIITRQIVKEVLP